jgi:DNA-binding response OmpR family regulator
MQKVMIIEDDQTMKSLLITLLEIEGFEVTGVEDFTKIIDIAKEVSPDVILMDVHLKNEFGQEINGLEILQKLKQNSSTKDIKVIMASGLDLKHKSIEFGAKAFLLKPYMPDELINHINLITN